MEAQFFLVLRENRPGQLGFIGLFKKFNTTRTLLTQFLRLLKERNSLITLAFALLAILALIWPALYNGYPLFYSDSASYLGAGFDEELRVDRPIAYSLFVRHMSLAESLWFVVLAQSIVVLWSVFYVTRFFVKRNALRLACVFVILISFGTAVSNYNSQIMADIFCAVSLLGFAGLVSRRHWRFTDYLFLIVVVYSAATHLSIVILMMGMGLVVLILAVFRLVRWKSVLKGAVIASLSLLLVMYTNWSFGGGFVASRAGNVFLFARMLETGVVQDYLEKNCSDESTYVMCDHIHDFKPHAFQFIWEFDESPLYDSACLANNWPTCLLERNQELGEHLQGIWLDGSYTSHLLGFFTEGFFLQLADYKVGHLNAESKKAASYHILNHYMPKELRFYTQARQFGETQTFSTITLIQNVSLILSGLLFVLLFILRKRFTLTKDQRLLVFLVFIGMLGNAMVVNLFASVLDRYMGRIIWIIPLFALLLLVQLPAVNSFLKRTGILES